MTENSKKLDIAQRIAEALSRTSEPYPSGGCSINDNDKEVIGSVPMHLRHLHNLVHELGDEVRVAERVFQTKKERFDAVRCIFFDALETYVPDPEESSGVYILENWNVIGIFVPDNDDINKLLTEIGAAARRH